MTETSSRSDNPYVGPRAFTQAERHRFFGRDKAGRELLSRLLTDRVVLLHSSSGAGKSSLIHAKLVPTLRKKEGFHVYPTIRVNSEVPSAWFGSRPNRYVYSALNCLEQGRKAAGFSVKGLVPGSATRELAAMSLATYLDQNAPQPEGTGDLPKGAPRPELLIFDQFEEILTIEPSAYEAKFEFFRQLADMLRPRHRWALFAMREEHVAALDPYGYVLPSSLSNRYYLELLDPQHAREAIEKPAAGQVPPDVSDDVSTAGDLRMPVRKVKFDKAALDLLIDNLRAVRREGVEQPTKDRWIEPVYLQVVCSALWDKISSDASTITVADVNRIGDVDKALATYYRERVKEAAEVSGVAEAIIRGWIESQLITRNIRSQVLKDSENEHGLNSAAVGYLDQKFIIRQDNRRNSVWYELAHDRLIHPVKTDNATWFSSRGAGRLHQLAEFWANNGRPAHVLLVGQALTDAIGIMREEPNNVTPALRELVRASRDHRAGRRRVAVLGALALAMAVWGGVMLEASRDSARELATVKSWQDSVLKVLPLLREKDWGLALAQQSAPMLRRSLLADSMIKVLRDRPPESGPPDTVIYYVKPSDPRGAQGALTDLGFFLDVQKARSDAVATNAIAYARNSRVGNVTLVALALIRAGVQLRMVCPPNQGTHDSHAIQVFSTSRAQRRPQITIEQILRMNENGRSINCAP